MKGKKASAAAASGAVALIFLILGFQIAIFSGNVFKFRQQARSGEEAAGAGVAATADGGAGAGSDGSVRAGGARSGSARSGDARSGSARSGNAGSGDGDSEGKGGGENGGEKSALRKALEAGGSRERDYSDSRTVIADRLAKKKVETFEFDPNTVALEDLCRLGFSERQAQVILNYRDKGGRFRSPADFQKMYVVDSATFARLESYIRIPKLDLNSADSEALLALRGIGPYYASKILSYRRRLGGSFTSLDQLLEIDGFDRGRLDGFRNDVELRRPPKGFDIWTATQAQLEAHPYIGSYAAKGIIRFKRTVDSLSWTLSALVDAGILSPDKAAKLK
ncbi:MAG: helix-hairpin-helix domain-containing protein [Bacteroidales bacterium]|nr:helix-hairpin-helix domain-containing protein [Bacteroidales bacterium]